MLVRGWLSRERADATLRWIRATTAWRQERRTMYDRVVDVPREQAAYEAPLPEPLDTLRRELEAACATSFAYVLLNRYRDGRDSVAWHNDRAARANASPTIASLTLGATRSFDVRRKDEPAVVYSVDVDHGDLIVMSGDSQRRYDHRVRKDARVGDERINLTFRERGVS